MSDDQSEPPWEVNEYRYEPPLWVKILFCPWHRGVGVPLRVLIGIALWERLT